MNRANFGALLGAIVLAPTVRIPAIAKPVVIEYGPWTMAGSIWYRRLICRYQGQFWRDAIVLDRHDIENIPPGQLAAVIKEKEEMSHQAIRDAYAAKEWKRG